VIWCDLLWSVDLMRLDGVMGWWVVMGWDRFHVDNN
jgi:hypothetical protein